MESKAARSVSVGSWSCVSSTSRPPSERSFPGSAPWSAGTAETRNHRESGYITADLHGRWRAVLEGGRRGARLRVLDARCGVGIRWAPVLVRREPGFWQYLIAGAALCAAGVLGGCTAPGNLRSATGHDDSGIDGQGPDGVGADAGDAQIANDAGDAQIANDAGDAQIANDAGDGGATDSGTDADAGEPGDSGTDAGGPGDSGTDADAGGPSDAGSNDAGAGPTLYVIGGGLGDWGLPDPPNASIPDVIAAPIHADGTLGAWVNRPPLPHPYVHGNPAVLVGDNVYVPGEFGTPSSGAMTTVLFADVATDGKWYTTTPLPTARGGWANLYGAATDGDLVFVAGGCCSNTSVIQAHALSTGGLGAWSASPSLPVALSQQRALAVMGQLYVFGETGSQLVAYHAPIQSGVGLGSWSAQSGAGYDAGYYAAAAWGSHIYIIGGTNGSNAAIARVTLVTVASDGSPGAFTTESPLPQGRSNACAVAGPNAVYVIGGEPGHGSTTTYDTVYYGSPTSDGSIGVWRTTTPLPSSRSGVSCVIRL